MVGSGSAERGPEAGRLSFSARAPAGRTGRRGLFELQDTNGALSAMAYVPADVGMRGPLRLVVYLHGAGGDAERTINGLRPFADDAHLLLVAPQAREATWDVITGGYGPDVRNIDSLLGRVSAAYPIRGYTVGGFSDGASYGLSLGVANGDLFDSVLAFSPGFSAARTRSGRPRFFVSHGVDDEVLPIEQCSRRLVPQLRALGYDVTYEEFQGGHEVPPEIKEMAVDWLGGGAG